MALEAPAPQSNGKAPTEDGPADGEGRHHGLTTFWLGLVLVFTLLTITLAVD